jgi:zinc protease
VNPFIHRIKRLPALLPRHVLFTVALSAVCMAPAIAGAATAAKAAPAPTPTTAVKVTSVEGITEYRLANGLRVLLFPDPSKPTLTTNIVYMVGSRYENYGETGMAHLLEHLMFKPSANFGVKKGTKTPVEVLNETGARFNGTTWYDRTNYFETFPASADNLRRVLALEADRMVNAAIDGNDLWNPQTKKGEMTVVRNEYEAGESDPTRVTLERIEAVAYDWHNYGKSTIGARSDIEQVDIGRLRAFYKKYYQPDNAVLMVGGRFDEAGVLRQIEQQFGRIPRPARLLTPDYTVEPVQDGERSVTVRRNGGFQFVGAGYHVAASGQPHPAALMLLADILVDAPSGRLYKALVESKLATSLQYSGNSNLEPGYRIFGADVPRDGNLDQVQQVLLNVLEDLKDHRVTDAEVARAKQQVNKYVEHALADTAGLTIALTESLAAGDWRLFFVQRDQIEKLDAAAVQAAAVKYLKASNRTVGRFIPTDAPDRVEVPGTPDIAAIVGGYQGRAVVAQGEAFDPSPANIEACTQRFTLPSGLQGALLPKKTKGETVSLVLQLRMGTDESLRGKATAAAFVPSMLMRGTVRLSRQEIKDAFDRLNAQVNLNGGAEGVTAFVTVRRDNLAPTLDLLAEVLRKPAFPAAEFAQLQREWVGSLEQNMPEPQTQAGNAFSRLLDATPEDSVRHVDTLAARLDKVKSATLAEATAFYAAFYGADRATVSAVGDFDALALKAQLATLFGDWKAAQPYVRIADTVKPVAGAQIALATPDKANSVLYAVEPVALRDDDAAYPALVMANRMLGGGALRSRLADRIRQKEGLSYGISSQLNIPSNEAAGWWSVYAISAPQNSAKVEAALREELDRALAEGFQANELADAKSGWRQSAEVARTQDTTLAWRLSHYLGLNRTMAYEQTLEDKVAALTAADVNAVLRQYLHTSALSVVRAGDFNKPATKEKADKAAVAK